jgi:L-cysteine S-thiosulfotransferase
MRRSIILAGAVTTAVVVGCTTMKDEAAYRDEATLVLKRDFHARGIAKMDRLNQDELQRVCTQYHDKPPFDIQKRLEDAEAAKIKLPADAKYMGDWQKGAKIAANGRGMTWRDKPGAPNGGSCYNCHQLAPQQKSFGTVGPSLLEFGKKRGYTVENQKYVYERIYDSKAFTPCSAMPRFGTSGTLKENQIKDLVAYLMDPNSPVNK